MERLIEYLKIFAKYRKYVYRITGGFIIFAIILSLLTPNRFRATAQLLPPVEETDLTGLSSALQSVGGLTQMRAFARMSGLSTRVAPTTLEMMRAILLSRTIMEKIIEKCALMKIFKSKYMEDAIKSLNNITKVIVLPEGVLQIMVEDNSPERAAKIANTFISELDQFLRISNMTRGKNTRIFIESRLAEAQQDLKAAEESLKVFQIRHKIAALDNETQAAIENYAKLKIELIKQEIELNISQKYSYQGNPYLTNIKREIAALKKSLSEMESSTEANNGFGVGFAIPFKKLPDVGTEYVRRYRNLKIQESVYTLMMQEYEQAKIMEVRDTPAITVLDYAAVPKRKIWPKRTLIIALFTFTGLFLSLAFGIVKESASKSKKWSKFYIELRELLNTIRQDFIEISRNIPFIRK